MTVAVREQYQRLKLRVAEMGQRLCSQNAVPDTPTTDDHVTVVGLSHLRQQRQQQQSPRQNYFKPVLVVVSLISVLLFFGFLLSTDNTVTRLIDDSFRRQWHQQVVNCRPCRRPDTAATSTDTVCCDFDIDLPAFVQKVLYYRFRANSRFRVILIRG